MFRDAFTVPTTEAGVEREFSKCSQVVTSIRARLNPTTVTENMLVKSMLVRQKKMLKEQKNDINELKTNDDIEEEETVEMNYVHELWWTLINSERNHWNEWVVVNID